MYKTDEQRLEEYRTRLEALEHELALIPFGLHETLLLLTEEIREINENIDYLEDRLNPTILINLKDYEWVIRKLGERGGL